MQRVVGLLMNKYLTIVFLLISTALLVFAKFSFRELFILFRQKNSRALTLAIEGLNEIYTSKTNKVLDNLDVMLSMTKINLTPLEYISINLLISSVASIIGFFLNNLVLSVVIFVAVNILSFQTLKHIYYKELRKLDRDLNLSMSLITNSYTQSENFIKAIKSNIYKLPESVKEVFMDFLVQVEMVNPDLKKGVFKLRREFQNIHFKKWCDFIVHCLDDRDYIKVLPAVVKEMAEERDNQNKLDSIVNEVYKENVQLLIIAALTPFLLKIVFPEMLVFLLNTTMGKIIIALNYLLITFSLGEVLTIKEPSSVSREFYE
jgi:hypothetical protein